MTETPEQRRERLELAIWDRLTFEPCTEPCWTWSNPIQRGCECVNGIFDALIASDEAAGLVVVPAKSEDTVRADRDEWDARLDRIAAAKE